MSETLEPKERLPEIPGWAPKRGSLWVHAKGREYTVVGTGYDEATLAIIVVYTPDFHTMWVRSLSNFLDRFKRVELSIGDLK